MPLSKTLVNDLKNSFIVFGEEEVSLLTLSRDLVGSLDDEDIILLVKALLAIAGIPMEVLNGESKSAN